MTILSVFGKPNTDEIRFENAKTHLGKRSDIRLENLMIQEYELMSPKRKFQRCVAESYLTWREGRFVFRYVNK